MNLDERKTSEIELFGYKLKISERYALDVIKLSVFWKKHDTGNAAIYSSASIVRDALRINIEELGWQNFIKKIRFRRLLSLNNILAKLSVLQLNILNEEIFVLEGADREELKKKATISQIQT